MMLLWYTIYLCTQVINANSWIYGRTVVYPYLCAHTRRVYISTWSPVWCLEPLMFCKNNIYMLHLRDMYMLICLCMIFCRTHLYLRRNVVDEWVASPNIMGDDFGMCCSFQGITVHPQPLVTPCHWKVVMFEARLEGQLQMQPRKQLLLEYVLFP